MLSQVFNGSFKILLKKFESLREYLYQRYLIFTINKRHKLAFETLKGKHRIKVVFFVIHSSVWKYDLLYNLFDKDSRFEPVIVICPYTLKGQEVMERDMDGSYRFFEGRGYKALKSYDMGKWLDVKREIDPDLVFFTNPYLLTKKDYYITNWLDTLTFYVPYAFMITNRPLMQYNTLLHNLVFRVFYESSFQLEQARAHSRNKGANGVVLGYPGLDELLFPNSAGKQTVWKQLSSKHKKIIWAPHHSIEHEDNAFNYSNFLNYADVFMDIAKEFKDEIQICFKPHPILKAKLYEEDGWGRERTDSYYREWGNLYNGQIDEDSYINLFLTSDAMIHDSGSFLTEYICLNKPSLYMIRNDDILKGFTSFGGKVVDAHYKSRNVTELYSFVKDIVMDGKDTLIEGRQKLIKEYLLPLIVLPQVEIFLNILQKQFPITK